MSNNNNDERILLLRKQIEAKKEKLGKSKRFSPITNCHIEIEGKRYNLHSLNKVELVRLQVILNMYRLSVVDLGLESFETSGYELSDWMEDIKSRLEILSRAEEEKSLKRMEKKLSDLLSERKKVELELDEMESMLKEEDE